MENVKTGKDLTLGDYRNIWTKFCFLDESGSLNNPNDPFFTVGFVKCSQPYYLQSKIIYERQKRNFHDELHFNKLSKNNIEFCKFALDAFFSTRSMSFSSYTLDKHGDYFNREFGGDPWRAYESIAIRVLESAISPSEIIIVNADYISVPDNVRFEIKVKRKINEKLGRLGVAGVCRFNSKSNDLLQLADLFVGMINYDLKLASKIIITGDKYKRRLVEHFKENLDMTGKTFLSLDEGFKNYMFNIFIDKDAKQRLPLELPILPETPEILETNEKGPSS